MKRSALLVALFTAVITLVLPFVGGSGPSLMSSTAAFAETPSGPMFASEASAVAQVATATIETGASDTAVTDAEAKAALSTDSEHLAQKPVPKPKPKPVVSQADKASGTAARRAAAAAAGCSCPGGTGGATGGAPATTPGGAMSTGTTCGDPEGVADESSASRR